MLKDFISSNKERTKRQLSGLKS